MVGQVLSFAQGKATSMGTEAFTSAAALPSAGPPSGTAPSVGPAQSPAEAAAAAAKATLTPEQRRKILKDLAEELKKTEPDRVKLLGQLADKASELVQGLPNPTEAMLEDLKLVVIGEGLLNGDPGWLSALSDDFRRRGTGPDYAGPFPGSDGFDDLFADASPRGDQASHALAGIYIGHHYPAAIEQIVLGMEDEPYDDRLYIATFRIGNQLNDSNYKSLGTRIRELADSEQTKTTADAEHSRALRRAKADEARRVQAAERALREAKERENQRRYGQFGRKPPEQ